jgi:pimeloyl-ACP methyl ester carboxylesterase
MMWLAWSLRRRLGRPVQVRRVQYRKRGWNSPGRDAVRDADAALSRLRRDVGSDDLVLVGHSMGFQIAA